MKKNIPVAFGNITTVKKIKIFYLKESCPGINRKKIGKYFNYYNAEGEIIKDTDVLIRIKSLIIPPAWKNVWISPYNNSHLQATGYDARGRKQYRYHCDWNTKRSETKFSRLITFARTLPGLMAEIENNLKQKELTKEKVTALVVKIMSVSFIRIGNHGYEKENGSYGLTTLKDKHVNIHGDSIKFAFKGKKGVWQDIELHDKRLARMVKSCRDIPGHELFQYYDDEGQRHVIDSGDVNSFLHQICGTDFSAKDFRTWAGSLHAFKALTRLPIPETETEFKHKTLEVIKDVSKLLGNTPAVCRKYYVHPIILESYGKGELFEFYKTHNAVAIESGKDFEEDMLIEFLERN